MDPDLTEAYLRFTFALVAQAPFEHLHWGRWDAVPHQVGRLAEAQRRYADAIVARVPEGVGRVLDVGCGLGGIARMLVLRGHEVVGLNPHRPHVAALEGRLPGLEVRPERFEEHVAAKPYDAVVLAESLAFFLDGPLRPFLAQLRRVAAPGATVVMADLAPADLADRIAAEGWTVALAEDWSEHVAFTVDALQHLLERALPMKRLLLDVVATSAPELAADLAAALDAVPNEAIRALLEGRLVERTMLEARPYQCLVLRA